MSHYEKIDAKEHARVQNGAAERMHEDLSSMPRNEYRQTLLNMVPNDKNVADSHFGRVTITDSSAHAQGTERQYGRRANDHHSKLAAELLRRVGPAEENGARFEGSDAHTAGSALPGANERRMRSQFIDTVKMTGEWLRSGAAFQQRSYAGTEQHNFGSQLDNGPRHPYVRK